MYYIRPNLMVKLSILFRILKGSQRELGEIHALSLLEQSDFSKTDYIHGSGRHDLSLLEQSFSSKTDHMNGSGWASENCNTISEHSPATRLKNLQKVSQPRGKFCIRFQYRQCGVPVPVNEWCACVEY